MSTPTTDGGALSSAIQRGILGLLLAILFFMGLPLVDGLVSGDILPGLAGLVLVSGTSYWIMWLFLDGIRN